MSALISISLLVLYFIHEVPEMLIASGLFCIGAEICALEEIKIKYVKIKGEVSDV